MSINLEKWNFKTHEYEPFESSARVLTLYTDDMLAEVDCANCGKRIPYGDTYTSRTIHSQIGLGYPVCEDCYGIERNEEKEQER